MSNHLDQPARDIGNARRSINGIDCAEALDLIPAMALGAIETGARHAVRLHCEICPVCAAELAASERIASFLPLSAPVVSPPPRAKQALFARIAEESAESPTIPIITGAFDAPFVDSPAAKRQASPTTTNRNTFGIGDLAAWPKAIFAGSAAKFVAAPLALALVFVSIYAFQALDADDATVAVLPTAAADTAIDQEVAAIDEASLQEITFLSADTRGASITQPLAQQYSTATSPYVARSFSAGGQTESLRSVAPKLADCSLVRNASGTYNLVISGVSLPGSIRQASVYLVTYAGERIRVGSVELDDQGNGSVTFALDRPLSAFRSLQIGPAGESFAVAGPPSGVVSFTLTGNDRSAQGLTRSS